MAEPSPPTLAPVSPEAFLADREDFLHRFWRGMFGAFGAAAVVLALMAIFLT